jgi:hypothetical protein
MSDVLAEHEWTAREAAHQDRAEAFLAPHQRRAQRGQAHPVWDFLFTYYSLRPRQLRRWHPGFGVALAGPGAGRFLNRTGYRRAADGTVSVDPDLLLARRGTI